MIATAKMPRAFGTVVLSSLFLLILPYTASAIPSELPAFPGAEGFGAKTQGGRGGRIIEVTNLNPEGPGSFRAACEAEGPRIVVFRVGGTITDTKDVIIRNPNITIAAQTAPGDGICLRGTTLNIIASDVIVRGLRVRTGDSRDGPNPENRDAIHIGSQEATKPEKAKIENIIVDHCTASWAIDENIDVVNPAHNVTVQWCLIAEGLSWSIHPKTEHSKGMMVNDKVKQVSVHHNLFAHNRDRHPVMKGGTTTEVINNVIYDWSFHGTNLSDPEGSGPYKANIIGNYYMAGAQMRAMEIALLYPKQGSQVYVKGNIGPDRPVASMPEWSLVEGEPEFRSETPAIEPSGVTTQSAAEAKELVIKYAGAIAPRRDAADERVVRSAINRTGRAINSEREVGGWPELKDGPAPEDSDHDGIPDDWEKAHGLDSHNSADGNSLAPTGYTWVEEYINSLIPPPEAPAK